MKFEARSVIAAIVVIGPALAQSELPPFDVSAGFTLVRMAPGPEVDRTGLPGWNASMAVHPFSRFGIAAEFAGGRRASSLSGTLLGNAEVRLNQNTFLFGPQRRRFTTSFRALFGVARLSSEFPSDVVQSGIAPGATPPSIGVFDDETAFATGIGSVWDIRISRSFAWRVNPGLLFTRFGGETQVTPRFSTGLMFRFGGGERP